MVACLALCISFLPFSLFFNNFFLLFLRQNLVQLHLIASATILERYGIALRCGSTESHSNPMICISFYCSFCGFVVVWFIFAVCLKVIAHCSSLSTQMQFLRYIRQAHYSVLFFSLSSFTFSFCLRFNSATLFFTRIFFVMPFLFIFIFLFWCVMCVQCDYC